MKLVSEAHVCLNFIYLPLMGFFLGALTESLPHESHEEFFEVPVMVLHLALLLHVVLSYSEFSLLPQHQHYTDVSLSHLE